MKRLTALFLVLALAALYMGSALADAKGLKGKTWPDFSVKTADGGTFTLSESLKTHDLVLINFWATWCGPCQYEFPFLEKAWEQYADRVDVIALSVEDRDTNKKIKQFAAENGLKFPMGRDEKYMYYDKTDADGIPTTVIVDRNLKVVAVEVGCMQSVREFTDLFDSLLPEEPTEEPTEKATEEPTEEPSKHPSRNSNRNRSRNPRSSPRKRLSSIPPENWISWRSSCSMPGTSRNRPRISTPLSRNRRPGAYCASGTLPGNQSPACRLPSAKLSCRNRETQGP